MQFLKKIVDFYIFSNIHVAVAGFCITEITVLKYGIQESFTPLFVLFSIIISYNFIRFYELKTNRLLWLKDWFFRHKIELVILNIIAIIALIGITFFTSFNIKGLLILIPFSFMTFFYVIPIFKLKNIEISFRNFPSVKIFSIAFAWAGISVFFPIYEAKMNITFDIFIEFIQRFALLIVIIIPFDIRDVKSDSDSLKTLPQVLGIKVSKIIGMVLLLFTIGLEFCKMIFETSTIIIWVIIALITAIFLWFSSENKSRYYAGFWVESIPIYWLILVIYFFDNFK
ncbi:hypothetical protein [Lutibacter sp.]|uniref:hypothetical protein n=1 Tax=Lutibacter sp. TaxID=1925666 RepID=UPI001A1DCAD9|nr:hypothetical protein [Lutibacter sp.]MBI9042555.1 hypothetical protein [Lutibacter sp.]